MSYILKEKYGLCMNMYRTTIYSIEDTLILKNKIVVHFIKKTNRK